MKHLATVLLLASILAACGRQVENQEIASARTRVTDSVCSIHAIGVSFPSEDGCNSCMCDSRGMMACTQMACLPE